MTESSTEVRTSDGHSASPTVPGQVIKAITSFIADHGGSAKAVVQPIGRVGVRITLVGSDGVLGDQVVPDLATAHAVVNSLAALELSEWDRSVTSIVTPIEGHYTKMAGWVARS
ncbi:MAG: hypothetical protein ACRCSF_00780 [Mycobacteriaceae bacterium]